jgi:cell division protein FtsB
MARPPKPLETLKKHLTKAERAARQRSEAELMTKSALQEWPEVRENKIAHARFAKIKSLLGAIGKNDALIEPVINRYCLILAESTTLEKNRERIDQDIDDLTDHKDDYEDYPDYIAERQRLTALLLKCDQVIQSKRKLLLDIEKENLGTVAAMLRAVQKKPVEEKDPDEERMDELAKRRAVKKG